MTIWKCICIGIEGERISLNGVNPWNHEWTITSASPIELPHPSYSNQMHKMNVYEIQTGGRTITFAAGELSANIWGFYASG